MTAFRPARPLHALLLSASALAIATPAAASEVVFSTDREFAVETGERTTQASGLTQIRLDSGAMASFVDSADYRINADGSIDLYAGSVTVAGAQGETAIRLPDGVEGRVGSGAAASFSVGADGASHGHALTGAVTILRGGNARTFDAGELWAADDERLRQVVSNGAQSAPSETEDEPRIADMDEGGPLAAAENGMPVSLGDALAAAGASGDVLAAARRVEAAAGNPDLATFPTGDLALLVSYSAQLQGAYGGQPFPGAQADVIRAYLGFLADGGAGANFLTAYSSILVQYLDLLRSGALPSSFQGAGLADINAFIGYTGRTSGFGGLSAQNRALIDAYLAFLTSGGNPDLFARSYTDLVTAYFAFLRGGGDPLAFQGASQQTLAAYIGFLSQSGLAAQLSAADRALIQAYLANGGLAFTSQYRAALDAYFAFLNAGNLPSGYTALDAATLRAYLEALQSTGLFNQVLGARAEFYAAFLAHLQSGGAIDAFSGLNANIFAGYSAQLAAYYEFLLQGGQPSAYTLLTQQQIAAYLSAIQAAGASDAFLDELAAFYTGYFAYLSTGADPDFYTGLPALNLPGFADALNAYYAYLAAGGLPSGYTAVNLETLAQYIDALARSGQLAALLGPNADLLNAYFAHLATGGAADRFAGLPVYADYHAALEAYYAFLDGGGLPSAYTLLTQAQIRAYLEALNGAGILSAQYTGDQLAFILALLTYLQSGADPDQFAELPVNNQPASLLASANVWIFSNEGGRVGPAPTADVAESGQIRRTDYNGGSVVSFDYTGPGNTLREHGRVSNNVAWTRYERGNAGFGITNANVHLLLGSPATDLPASGTVDYKLIGGTAPTDAFAPAGEIGSFTGDLAVAFGATPKVGLNFDVHVGTRGWRAQTPGGAAGAATGGLAVGGTMTFQHTDLARSGIAGNACSGYCNVQVFGGLFGAGAGNAGFQYFIDDQSSGGRSYVNGVAVFGTSGTEVARIGTMPSAPVATPSALTGYTGGFSATSPYVDFAVAGRIGSLTFVGGEFGYQATAYSLAADGTLNSYTRPGAVTRTPGSTTVSDIHGNADAVIERWSNGTTGGSGANAAVVNANQGVHILLTRPISSEFALPTTGRIDYYQIAATKPTIANGSMAPGTFQADMALLLGSTVKVAMHGQITMPSLTYSFSTTGGISNATATETALTLNATTGRFSFSVPGTDGTAGCATPGTCTLGVYGGFTGSDTDTIGIAYQANRAVLAEGISGTAIFAAGPARAVAAGGIAPAEWSRFASDTGPSAPAVGVPETAISATDAAALLGGAITFDH